MAQPTVGHPADLPTVLAAPSPAATAFSAAVPPQQELERQVRVYVDLGFPALLGLDEAGLRALVAPLRARLPALDAPTPVPPDDHVPFLLVVTPGAGTSA